MKRAKKTQKRLRIIEKLVEAVSDPVIYDLVDVRRNSEAEWSRTLHSYLHKAVEEVFQDLHPRAADDVNKKRAYDALLWDSDKSTVINSITFFGVQHRPDYEIKLAGFTLGMELKRGGSGSDVRDGLGQSLVYAQQYDFVLYIFADASADKRIAASLSQPAEKQLLAALWEQHNIQFVVV